VGIAQYQSYYFKKNNILAPDKHALDVLNRLKTIYAAYEQHEIVRSLHAHNADTENWMMLIKPRL
jgi:hypothetical protein